MIIRLFDIENFDKKIIILRQTETIVFLNKPLFPIKCYRLVENQLDIDFEERC